MELRQKAGRSVKLILSFTAPACFLITRMTYSDDTYHFSEKYQENVDCRSPVTFSSKTKNAYGQTKVKAKINSQQLAIHQNKTHTQLAIASGTQRLGTHTNETHQKWPTCIAQYAHGPNCLQLGWLPGQPAMRIFSLVRNSVLCNAYV